MAIGRFDGRGPRARWSGVLVLAAIGAIAGGGVGAAAAAGTGSSGPTQASGTPFTQTTDPSQEDYYDQFDNAVNVEGIANQAQAAFGQRFAGYLIDRQVTPNMLRIYVLNATSKDQDTLATIASGNPQVAVQPAQVSWNQLLAAKDAVGQVASQLDIWPADIGPDLAGQDVRVFTESPLDQSSQDAMTRAAGGIKVQFTASTGTEGQALDCATCFPPYKGGKKLRTQIGDCTTGFTLQNSDGSNFFGSSAGHCSREGDHVHIGDNDLGAVNTSTFYGNPEAGSDALDVPINASNAKPKVFNADTGDSKTVTARYFDSDLVTGTHLCYQGIGTGGFCDDIKWADFQIDYSEDGHNFTLKHAWALGSTDSAGGDSGGPVYHIKPDGSAKAAGGIAAKNAFGTWFSSIGNTLDNLNKHLMQG